MLISIITVSFNSEKTIEKAINSVLNQDYNEIEYIIIDGGSTDKTLEIVNKYSNRITNITSEPDNGIYDAINKGITKTHGEIIGLLHSDDEYQSNSIISLVMKEFLVDKQIDAVYGDLVYVKDNKIVRNWKSGSPSNQKFRLGWMPPHPAFFLKKNVYTKYGYYNTELHFSADYELMLRMIYINNINIKYIQKTLVKMNLGGLSNKSIANRLKANKEDTKAWELNKLTPPLLLFILKPMLKLKQFRIFK
ncbi:MAG: glycosyltransferase family 2 protein [Bacteroidota bacterium]|nr:glycosyltransferase family 2 protein [Bacteroidota bacterium]